MLIQDNFMPTGRRAENIQFEKETIQPWKKNGDVNEDFIKEYGADAHPDKEVREYYAKQRI